MQRRAKIRILDEYSPERRRRERTKPLRIKIRDSSGGYMEDVESTKPILSSRIIWFFAILVCLVMIGILIWLLLDIKQETFEFEVDEETVNLDSLEDLENAQCCISNAGIENERYLYLPSTGYTYTVDEIDPQVACANATGIAYSQCFNLASDSNDEPKPAGHKGTVPYYIFNVGQTGICQSFSVC